MDFISSSDGVNTTFKRLEDGNKITGSVTIPNLEVVIPELYAVLTPDERNIIKMAYKGYGEAAANYNYLENRVFSRNNESDWTGDWSRAGAREEEMLEHLIKLINRLAEKYGYSTIESFSGKIPYTRK